ncbi:MAG: hypothetical protein JW803_08240 [Endomicrobiales bacterium]|nr:hypothetical protein [Endomicrobiales bacterium]
MDKKQQKRFLWLVTQKLKYMLEYKIDEASYPGKVAGNRLGPLLNWPYIGILGLAGVLLSFKQWKKLVIFYGVIAAVIATNALYYPAQRYRLPMDFVLIYFSAWALFYAIGNLIRVTGIRQYFRDCAINEYTLNEIFGRENGWKIKYALISLLVAGVFIAWIGGKAVHVQGVLSGKNMYYDARTLVHGPAKLEMDRLFLPWASWLQKRMWLKDGKYRIGIEGYGEECEGELPLFKLNVDGQKVGELTFTKKLEEHYFDDVEIKGGERLIELLFTRIKPSMAHVYNVSIKRTGDINAEKATWYGVFIGSPAYIFIFPVLLSGIACWFMYLLYKNRDSLDLILKKSLPVAAAAFLLIVFKVFIWGKIVVPFYSSVERIASGGVLEFNPLDWEHGPLKEETGRIYMPWPSYLEKRIYLPKGDYRLTMFGYGEESRGNMPALDVRIDDNPVGKILLTKRDEETSVEFHSEGGQRNIAIVFKRTKEEIPNIYSIRIQRIARP